MKQQYQVIVMDPPFSFNDKLLMGPVKRGASSNYNTMTIEQIKGIPIKEIADPAGCLLALWCPSSLLPEGLDIMKGYGFNFKQTYIWVKNKQEPFRDLFKKAAKQLLVEEEINPSSVKNAFKDLEHACRDHISELLQMNLGRLFRQSHEVCLIGINNTAIYSKLENRAQRSVCFATNLKHSKKPEALQDALEIMFPNAKKVDIFARRVRNNWTCLGNESPETYGEDINYSINRLIGINPSL